MVGCECVARVRSGTLAGDTMDEAHCHCRPNFLAREHHVLQVTESGGKSEGGGDGGGGQERVRVRVRVTESGCAWFTLVCVGSTSLQESITHRR